MTSSGCSRAFYRQQADAQVESLIAQKAQEGPWTLDGDYTVNVPRGSRMYDPFSPDQPPQPPDDPASHQLMDFVDGKRGYPGWGANGFTNQVEGPYWINTLPSDGSNGILLNQDNAIRLSLLHSPSFQSEQETLYLSALDVSLERFQFDTQLFAGIDVGYEQGSRLRNPGGSSSTLTTTLDSNGERGISAQRMTATGGTLLVGIANSLMWQFSGPDSHTATS
ncbi:MAG: hypothetical protein NXI22_25840, partial [bacterium]|nr:hypothetical protein [bacterium]